MLYEEYQRSAARQQTKPQKEYKFWSTQPVLKLGE
jgi:hypothetical protein